MTDGEVLDVVNEADEIVGAADRTVIHRDAILHREVHVFVTDGQKIALQLRSSGARSWQGFLDATAGGHVERGETYLNAALHEMREELGFEPDESRLHLLEKLRIPTRDVRGEYHNNVWRSLYVYRLLPHEVLIPEVGKCDGFEWCTLDELRHPSPQLRARIIPVIIDQQYIVCYERMLKS
jgi:isopentenyldiphosphate isomerase